MMDLGDRGDLGSTAYQLASEIEGHPDNAAAASFGGLTVVVADDVERLVPHPDVRPVLLVPDLLRVSTDEARAVLSRTVSREDAVFNVGHAALTLIRLLRDPERLRLAMDDRLHQDARLALVPEAQDVFRQVREANIPVCVSGSGPTLLAFERERWPVPEPGEGWQVLRVPVRTTGVEILDG
jgi:homoserine kinase